MEIVGIYILHGFFFTHDFRKYGKIKGKRFTISERKVFFRYNLKRELHQKIKDICNIIPVIVVPVKDDERKNMYAIGFEVGYFSKHSNCSIPKLTTRLGLCEDEDEKDFMCYILGALCYDCKLKYEEFDYISIPQYTSPLSFE